MKAFVPYHGSKARILREVVGRMRAHETYFEPFTGTGIVFAHKPRATKTEVINDLDFRWYEVYISSRDFPEEMVSFCENTQHAREDWEKNVDQIECALPYQRAAAFLCSLAGAWRGKDNAWSTQRSLSTVQLRETIQALHSCFKDRVVEVYNKDAMSLLADPRVDDPSTFVYSDPPYKDTLQLAYKARFEAWSHLVDRVFSTRARHMISESDGFYSIYGGYPWDQIVRIPHTVSVNLGSTQMRSEYLFIKEAK